MKLAYCIQLLQIFLWIKKYSILALRCLRYYQMDLNETSHKGWQMFLTAVFIISRFLLICKMLFILLLWHWRMRGPLPWGKHVEKNWTAFTYLDDSSGEEFECFKIARSLKDILVTLPDVQEPNPISKLTKDDVKDVTGVN